jgi:hypothetical protein
MPSNAPFARPVADNPTSIAGRIRKFFADNPDEMLTYSDMVTKFDCTLRQIHGACSFLRARGLLATMHVVCLAEKTPQGPRTDE